MRPGSLVLVLVALAAQRALADVDIGGAVVRGTFTSNSFTGNLITDGYPSGNPATTWIPNTPGVDTTGPISIGSPGNFLVFGPTLVQQVQVDILASGLITLSIAGVDTLLGANEAILTLKIVDGLATFSGLTIDYLQPQCGGISLDTPAISVDGTITFKVQPPTDCGGGAPRTGTRVGPSAVFQLNNPICFPATSTLRRLAPDNAWETVAMPELRVGDTVECLAREPVFGRNNATSAAYGRLARCTVYGYKKAAATPAATYTRITYEGAGNDADTVAMSPNHHLLDPLTGQARQAGSLRPGDAVLRADASGALVPARVRSVASVREGGAYVPLLSGGGLPIVDGVVAYPSSGESDVGLDAKHWGQHYLHAPLWQALPEAAPPAGAEREASSPPVAGRTLAELGAQAPVAAFTEKWHAVRAAAAREGRATCDWAGVAAEMHAAITGQGKRYTEAEALAVLDKHHRAARRGVAEA